MSATDTARNAILGNPPDPNTAPSGEGLVQAFEQLEGKLDGLTDDFVASGGGISIASFGIIPENSPEDNDAALVELGSFPPAIFDMMQGVIPVTAPPKVTSFENGGWNVIGGAGDASTVDLVYPAPRTFDAITKQISGGKSAYEIGSQGTAHQTGRALDIEVCTVVHHGDGHYATGTVPHMYRKTREGVRFEDDGPIATPADGDDTSCFSAGAYGFLEFAIVRTRGTEQRHELYGRRVFERRHKETVTFTTSEDSSSVVCQLEAGKYWDLRVGDVVQISSVGDAVNGAVVNNANGGYVVEAVDAVARSITITVTQFTSSIFGVFAGSITRTSVDLTFLKTPWEKVLTLDVGTDWTLCHGMSLWDNAGDLKLEFATHGTGLSGPKIMTVEGLYSSTPVLSAAIQSIGSLSQGIEADQVRLSTGEKVGTVRASNTGLTNARVWYSPTADASDATIWSLTLDAFGGSPVAVSVDELNDLIIFTITDTRDNAGTPEQASIPLMIGWQSLSSFKVSGPTFTWWRLDDLFFSDMNSVTTSNAVGLVSTTLLHGVLYVFYTTESGPIDRDQDGQPRVFCTVLAMGPNGPVGASLGTFVLEAAGTGEAVEVRVTKVAKDRSDRRRALASRLLSSGTVTLVSDAGYTSFPVIGGAGELIVALMHHGDNHTRDDDEAVSLLQTATGAGAIAVNGNEASGAEVSVGAITEVTITADGDETGVTFTITGSANGTPVTIVLAGPNATTVVSTERVDAITSVTVDGATSGDVSVGLNQLACNIEVAVTRDCGADWSAPVAIFDGKTLGKFRYYFPMLGQLKDGTFIAVCTKIEIVDGGVESVYRTSADGVEWSSEAVMQITGDVPPLYGFYGKIKTTPSGKLIATAQTSDIQYLLTSVDDGLTWVSSVIPTGIVGDHSESTIEVVDELTWVVHVRIDGVVATLQQVMTFDAGVNWTTMGQINLPDSSGYDSHDTLVTTINGIRYFALLIMSRANTVAGLNPDSIVLKWCKVDDMLTTALAFRNEEIVIEGGLTNLSGYPSCILDPITGQVLMVMHRETAKRSAQVESKGFNLHQAILGDGKLRPFVPQLQDESGTLATLDLDEGYAARTGDQIYIEFDVRVSGSIGLTTGLTLNLSSMGSFVFERGRNAYIVVAVAEKMQDDTRDLQNIVAEVVDGTLLLNLNHGRQANSGSSLGGFEVNADFRVRGSGFLRVK